MLIEYVRKGGSKKCSRVFKDGKLVKTKKSCSRGGNKIGVFVAVPQEDSVLIGWSLCNTKAGDVFNQNRGIDIAMDRAIKGSVTKVAHSMNKKVTRFIDRAGKYYKDLPLSIAFEYDLYVESPAKQSGASGWDKQLSTEVGELFNVENDGGHR